MAIGDWAEILDGPLANATGPTLANAAAFAQSLDWGGAAEAAKALQQLTEWGDVSASGVLKSIAEAQNFTDAAARKMDWLRQIEESELSAAADLAKRLEALRQSKELMRPSRHISDAAHEIDALTKQQALLQKQVTGEYLADTHAAYTMHQADVESSARFRFEPSRYLFGRSKSSRAPGQLTPRRDPNEERDNGEYRESGLYIPTNDDIILPNGEPSRRGRGRPRGPVMSRDQLLDRLADAVRRARRYSPRTIDVDSALRMANLPRSTVYRHFANASFGWPGGRIGWLDVAVIIDVHLSTGRSWAELLEDNQ
jgi:hypothetical protein